jgi:hypothetical protein
MPKSLRSAAVVLARSVLSLAAMWLVLVFFSPWDIAILRMPERQTGARTPIVPVVAVVQVMLCVLVRTGSSSVRIFLTMTSVFAAVLALVSSAIELLEYRDFAERAAVLGGQVQLSGWGISAILIELLSFVATVIGLLLLYRPTSNAYIKHVSRLRSDARSEGR